MIKCTKKERSYGLFHYINVCIGIFNFVLWLILMWDSDSGTNSSDDPSYYSTMSVFVGWTLAADIVVLLAILVNREIALFRKYRHRVTVHTFDFAMITTHFTAAYFSGKNTGSNPDDWDLMVHLRCILFRFIVDSAVIAHYHFAKIEEYRNIDAPRYTTQFTDDYVVPVESPPTEQEEL